MTSVSNPNLKALILHWSATGNTEKVARTIEQSCLDLGVRPTVAKVTEADGIDLYAYDTVFLGCPSYSFLPPEAVLRFVKRKMNYHRLQGDIKPCAPKVPGKRAVVFVTYTGPHTGIAEATPVGQYLGQFFAHLGFEVLDAWYVVGEYHGSEENSTLGCLGDVRGRPNADDLAWVAQQTASVAQMHLQVATSVGPAGE